MADDWLTAAVDGMTLDNGLDTSGGGGESPSLANNISQLLKSTRRDRADLEARLTQLRGFIQQTDEVMRGIVESGDPTLAAKYTHLATTRRSLEQNAAHLHELLQKVTESEARARQLAERGLQLEADEVNGDVAAGDTAEPTRASAGLLDWPEHEQKVAVVRGRPGPGSRKRDAAEVAVQEPQRQDWAGSQQRGRQRSAAAEDAGDETGGAVGGVHMDRLLRALRGGDGRPAAAAGGSALVGAEAALRDKALELDATRQKLHQLRQLMTAVQEARTVPGGMAAESAPAELRALLGEVESALEAGEEEAPERGSQAVRPCGDCRGGGISNGPRSLPPAGEPRLLSRTADRLTPGPLSERMTPSRDLPPQMAPLQSRRAGSVTVPLPPPGRERASASLPPAHSTPATPGRESSIADDDVRSQLQQVTAMVQSLTRQPWPQQAPVWPLYQPPPAQPPYTVPGWAFSAATPQAEAQHQQTLSALGQVFQLLQSQQQQIQGIQHQIQSTAAAVAAAQHPPPPATLPPASFSHVGASLLRVDDPPTMELADGFPPNANAGVSMLNNQVAPGSRANNYWDNFRSYSRQNLLSGGSEPEAERPRGDSESFDDARAEGFMARPRTKRQKVNKENQQLERSLSNSLSNTTRPGVSTVAEPARPRAHRASTPQNNPQVDAIYSCVTALIAQNQEQPEFLIELLHDLQLVRSERQRQQVLLAVQSVVVQEVSGARHKQRNRGGAVAAGGAAVGGGAAAPAAAGHHALLTAEREEAKTSSHHMFNKHTKNWSHSQQRPEQVTAVGAPAVSEPASADPEDTTVAKNLAPIKNASTKNTTKPMTFEPTTILPLDDPELQLARVLHEMNVFLSDHHASLLSPTLLARLERLLLRTCGQARAGGAPPGLNQLLEEAMVPFMGQPVSEAGGRLVQAVLERLGAVLRGRDLLSSPPAAAPVHARETDSEEEEVERADRTETPGQLDTTDDGPQVIPEQEVPSLSGRELAEHLDRRGAEPPDSAVAYRVGAATPRDTPDPSAETLANDGGEPAELDA